ncbi:MAG TPA: tRNA (guanosine(46)-N7)-methyltransferase TrmB [Ferruginibacter sp.]|nr:tRNA (guanosine(46)-N7)-methyltransferase TrmB [Ferruginibacter sp.]HMP22373.1 tRNA (guanosine(46)-N7)-methyltransferase TrmB [Ferruginibacter sp.]
MGQKKLLRFNAIKSFENVKEYPEGMQGQWAAHFGNNNPLVLELACGKGEYTVGLAQLFPETNCIGIDIKGNRIYAGAKKCLEQHIGNAAFLRTQIGMLPNYFAPGEVDEIWITFPDPQLRTSRAKKRLTHPVFLRLYQQVLRPGGLIHLKTDSPALYQFTKAVALHYNLAITVDYDNVYTQTTDARLMIKTHYEALDIAGSNRIFYLQFTLPELIANKDAAFQLYLKETENNDQG